MYYYHKGPIKSKNISFFGINYIIYHQQLIPILRDIIIVSVTQENIFCQDIRLELLLIIHY
jgi:hypothetical protein